MAQPQNQTNTKQGDDAPDHDEQKCEGSVCAMDRREFLGLTRMTSAMLATGGASA